MFDVRKTKLLSSLQPGKQVSSFKVDWNPIKTDLILMGSSEGMCFLVRVEDQTTLTLHKQFQHPSVVFGVSWNTLLPQQFATACNDKCVRVYDVNANEAVLKKLEGHTDKVGNLLRPIF